MCINLSTFIQPHNFMLIAFQHTIFTQVMGRQERAKKNTDQMLQNAALIAYLTKCPRFLF